jgi:hypothetical protein
MNSKRYSGHSDFDALMLNARLRDELEPFVDESLDFMNSKALPTTVENEYLASILAWERAPVLPIGQWFQPELKLTPHDKLNDEQLHVALQEVIDELFARRIVLEFTEHLSDRQLYCLICRDILPSPEKKLDPPAAYLHWHCLDEVQDEEAWLRYYASKEEREVWAEQTNLPLPPASPPPYPRELPRAQHE